MNNPRQHKQPLLLCTPSTIKKPSQAYKNTLLTVGIGLLVATNFALAKLIVSEGFSVIAVLFWQLLIASLLLLFIIRAQAQSINLTAIHVRYYVIGGILGISIPQLASYFVLQHISASLFTVFVTLSPLMTFLVSSIVEKQMLPLYRLLGLLVGLTGISIVTISEHLARPASNTWLLIALCVPVLLGITNVYRSKAYPENSQPLTLAAGTLTSQVLLLLPFYLFWESPTITFISFKPETLVIVVLGAITALSYILTYQLQKRTDGIGFSQVGYFVTLSGILIGVIFFDEKITASLVIAAILLFLGIAITSGQFRKAP